MNKKLSHYFAFKREKISQEINPEPATFFTRHSVKHSFHHCVHGVEQMQHKPATICQSFCEDNFHLKLVRSRELYAIVYPKKKNRKIFSLINCFCLFLLHSFRCHSGKKISYFTIIAPALQLSQQLNSLYLLSNIESILSAFFHLKVSAD